MTTKNENRMAPRAETKDEAGLRDEQLQEIAGGADTSPSNIMKTKHDTAKNSISNVH
jgi:hypothetical protein